jgi:serine phosphatase RsbU (regulator of sigma subunit)
MVSLARSETPEKVMLDANEMLQELSTSDMFVTIFYAVINRHTLSLCYFVPGNEYPILIREGQAGYQRARHGFRCSSRC